MSLVFRCLTLHAMAYTPYWHNPNIHNVGNGYLHAALSPLATWVIDRVAYGGVSIRAQVRERFLEYDSVVDLCCGTGYSTSHVGIDTSDAMISVAKLVHSDKHFEVANAETFGADGEFDACGVFFALHEAPQDARMRILHNAVRISRHRIVVCDISPRKNASQLMLSGEPYLLEYQENIVRDLQLLNEECSRVCGMLLDEVVPHRVLVCVIDLTS